MAVGTAHPWRWGYFQRCPPALFGRMHRIEGGRMTLLLKHSSGPWVLGAEFPALGLASSVVCSVLLWECMCHTMDLSTKLPGADSRRSALPYTAVGHCVVPWPPSQKIQLHQFKHCFVLLELCCFQFWCWGGCGSFGHVCTTLQL